MELSRKTTILLSPELHQRLTLLAAQRRVSLGELIRSACEQQYGLVPLEGRLEAVRALESLRLPVGSPRRMKQQAAPDADDLLP